MIDDGIILSFNCTGYEYRKNLNSLISNDKAEFGKYSEMSRKLNLRGSVLSSDPFLSDCLHQPYHKRSEYNHIDAYLIARILDDFFTGKIIFAYLETKENAARDKEVLLNNQIIAEAKSIHGEIKNLESEFWGEREFCDGFLKFDGDVLFVDPETEEGEVVKKFEGLLEVGHTDISATFVHLYLNKGHLARFPYRHKKIGLFINKEFVPMTKHLEAFNL